MTLELNGEQIMALDMALKTRVRSIESLIYKWENNTIDDTTKYLIETYSEELITVNQLLENFNK